MLRIIDIQNSTWITVFVFVHFASNPFSKTGASNTYI